MNEPSIPDNGVSGKLKAVVYILTGITLFAFVAFFAKLITKYSAPKKQEKILTNPLIFEINNTVKITRIKITKTIV